MTVLQEVGTIIYSQEGEKGSNSKCTGAKNPSVKFRNDIFCQRSLKETYYTRSKH